MMNPTTRPSNAARRLTLGTALVAAACTLLSVSQPATAQAMGGMGARHEAHGGMGGRHEGHGGMGMMSERLLDDVKATPEQRQQIRQIMEAARKDLQAQREAGRALRDEAMRVFTQPNVDAQAVEALRQKRLAHHDQASRRMSQAMLEASRVLTPEQRQQLAQRMAQRQQMRERHQRERQQLEGPGRS